jgi:hypothetical protein
MMIAFLLFAGEYYEKKKDRYYYIFYHIKSFLTAIGINNRFNGFINNLISENMLVKYNILSGRFFNKKSGRRPLL